MVRMFLYVHLLSLFCGFKPDALVKRRTALAALRQDMQAHALDMLPGIKLLGSIHLVAQNFQLQQSQTVYTLMVTAEF